MVNQDGKKMMDERRGITKSIYFKIAAGAVFFRLIVYFFSVMIMLAFENYEAGYTFEHFLSGWHRWDGINYIIIAEEGYGHLVEGRPLFLVFYPAYPCLIRLLHLVISDSKLCGMMISVFAYAGGCCMLYRLMRIDYNEEEARNAVILISIFPFAYFFGAIMTESLFFLVSVTTLYYIRKHRFAKAALWGAVSCFTRSAGMLLAFALLTELCLAYHPIQLIRQRNVKEIIRKVLTGFFSCLGMAAGSFAYLGINYAVTGNPFQFMIYQKEHWSQGLGSIFNTVSYLWYYFRANIYNSNGITLWGPQLILLLISMIVIIYGIKRIRATYTVYFILYTLLTFSATWLLSGGRYTSCAVPLFMTGGIWLERHRKYKSGLFMISAMLFMFFLTAYHTWKSAF